MKLLPFYIFILSYFNTFAQQIKSIETDDYKSTYDINGKLISFTNSIDETLNYEYKKDTINLTETKTTYIQDIPFRKEIRTYTLDSLLINESIHQLTKFGTEVFITKYSYNTDNKKALAIRIDSLRNDTISITTFTYTSDSTIETVRQLSNNFITIKTNSQQKSYSLNSQILIDSKDSDTINYNISLLYPENRRGKSKTLSWSKGNWILDDIEAKPYTLFNKKGFALITHRKTQKNSYGDIIKVESKTRNNKFSYLIKLTYY